ncbi:MAG TPA: Uma2 family endonuclease [Roseiflexaceae bacterium]|nr:Uma2 family endonuclease [Roseiflexaceae bacterium]HMP39777.1 Uma2 family endonuclease [Roseiflexaceae bacterium]
MTLAERTRGLRIAGPGDDTVVNLEPLQGLWTVEQYLAMSDHSRRLLEYTDGAIEVLPMPTDKHQVISRFLLFALHAYVQQIGGIVLYAPLRLQIRAGKFREPDLLLVVRADDPRRQNRFWIGADLVVEIVSPDDPERDTVEKRADYAEAGIQEYWIVHPEDATMTILALHDGVYTEHGVFGRGEEAQSSLLGDFSVSVDAVLDAV